MRALSLLALLPILACGPEKDPSGVDDDADGDGVVASEDCDDGDATVAPGTAETCDGIDNNCDGVVDNDATDATVWAPDTDGDGYFDPSVAVSACAAPEAHIVRADLPADCDDTRADVHPGAAEICDGVNTDCDNDTTEAGVATWFDVDGLAADVTTELTSGGEYVLGEGTLQLCEGRFAASLVAFDDVVVRGFGGAVVDASGQATTLTVDGGAEVTLEDLTLTGGAATLAILEEAPLPAGGGVVCGGDSSLTLDGVTISGNSADIGGGIATAGCSVSAVDSTIEENTASVGGGIFAYASSLSLTDGTVQLNAAESGGGAYLYTGTTMATVGTLFRANTASSGADALYVDAGASASCASVGTRRGAFTRHVNPGAVELWFEGASFEADDCDFGAAGATDDNASPDLTYWGAPAYVVGDASTFDCVDQRCGEPVMTEVGGAGDETGTSTWTSGIALGNAFLADRPATLEAFSIYLGVSASCEVDAAAFSSGLFKTGTWELEWTENDIPFASGTGWVESGPVGLLLVPGEHYAAVLGLRCAGSTTTIHYQLPVGGTTGAGDIVGTAQNLGYAAAWSTDAVFTHQAIATLAQRFYITEL